MPPYACLTVYAQAQSKYRQLEQSNDTLEGKCRQLEATAERSAEDLGDKTEELAMMHSDLEERDVAIQRLQDQLKGKREGDHVNTWAGLIGVGRTCSCRREG